MEILSPNFSKTINQETKNIWQNEEFERVKENISLFKFTYWIPIQVPTSTFVERSMSRAIQQTNKCTLSRFDVKFRGILYCQEKMPQRLSRTLFEMELYTLFVLISPREKTGRYHTGFHFCCCVRLNPISLLLTKLTTNQLMKV